MSNLVQEHTYKELVAVKKKYKKKKKPKANYYDRYVERIGRATHRRQLQVIVNTASYNKNITDAQMLEIRSLVTATTFQIKRRPMPKKKVIV